jgi:metal-responsive CopG/Arc/MetJ family transcriptional regulator
MLRFSEMLIKQKIVGISFPKFILEELDRIREDVPRSRYIVRLIEKNLREENHH